MKENENESINISKNQHISELNRGNLLNKNDLRIVKINPKKNEWTRQNKLTLANILIMAFLAVVGLILSYLGLI